MRGAIGLALAALVWTPAAWAQGQGTGGGAAGGAQAQGQPAQRADALASRCVALLHGQAPQGADAAQLRSRCEGLVRSGARVEAGVGTAAPQPGQNALAAFEQAGRQLVGGGNPMGMGMTGRGPVRWTLMTDPLAWFTGIGVNLELQAPIPMAEKFSWLVGARYSRTDATNGSATAFGAEGGLDWFILGGNNAGLRIGPRIELALGQESFQGSTTFGRVGLGGELGYNFIASNGLTGTAAVGLGGRIAGNQKNTDFNSFTGGGNLGPYFKLGVGYSW